MQLPAKLNGKCAGCKRPTFLLFYGKVTLPTGQVATSKDLLCRECIHKIRKVI